MSEVRRTIVCPVALQEEGSLVSPSGRAPGTHTVQSGQLPREDIPEGCEVVSLSREDPHATLARLGLKLLEEDL